MISCLCLLTVVGLYHQILKWELGLLVRVCHTSTQDASLGYIAKVCLKTGGAGAGNWYLIKAWDTLKS